MTRFNPTEIERSYFDHTLTKEEIKDRIEDLFSQFNWEYELGNHYSASSNAENVTYPHPFIGTIVLLVSLSYRIQLHYGIVHYAIL